MEAGRGILIRLWHGGGGMGLGCYHALGQKVEDAWRRAGHDVREFPKIAASALSDFDPPHFDPVELGRHLLHTPVVQQPQTRFSNLPLMLYRAEGFYLELLVWTKGTTSIHQHGFSGAFRVVAGSSLHTDYRFVAHRQLGSRMAVGEVQACGMRRLVAGDVMQIRSGPDGLIHSLFHLDNPSATLVARTWQDPGAGPQYELLKPGVALDTPWAKADPLLVMLQRWLSVCAEAGGPAADEGIVDLVLGLDADGLCALLLEHGRFLGVDRPESGFMDKLERRHPDLSTYLLEVFRHRQLESSLIATRGGIQDAELRYFVALLINSPSFDDLCRMVLERFPGADVVSRCADWLIQLAAASGSQLAIRPGSPLLVRLSMALANAGPDARVLLEGMLKGASFATSSPEDMRGDEARLRRMVQSEKALRTTPELSVLFGAR